MRHIGQKDANEYYMTDKNNNPIKINNTESEKDLGVPIDKSLNFRQHILPKIKKAIRNLGIINRTFTYMNKSMFFALYKSLVRPHLEYAS